MCGICGVVRLDGEGQAVDPARLVAMTRSLTHRGPDDEGYFVDSGVALGVRRLSIVDVAHGHQPVSNENEDVWAVQNGELYNHEELRDGSLRSHRFLTRCDTEILPHAYEEFGVDLAAHIHGEFSFAVWDGRNKRLVLARDRPGVKPLYYAQVDGLLVFASELKAILVSGLVGDEIDREAVSAYLALGYFPAPSTPFRHIQKLLPGHRLVASRSGVRVDPYWRFPAIAGHEVVTGDPTAAAGEVRDVLRAVTHARLMSDVPVGLMLSGGLDSTLILSLMAEASSAPVPTFTVGFRGLQSELEPAREIARHYGCDHHELELPVELSSDELDELLWSLDEPIADLSAVGFNALCAFASRHVKVVLSGQGADELFGGYAKHVATAALARVGPRMTNVAVRAARLTPFSRSRTFAAAAAHDPVERLFAMSALPHPQNTALAGAVAAARNAVDVRVPERPRDPFAATLYLDSQLALPDDMLHYFDRVSMAHSLEVRVPFVDHQVVEAAAALSPRLKVDGRTGKHILREVARGAVPAEVLRRKKVGFMYQVTADWVRSQLPRLSAERLSDAAAPWRAFLDDDAFSDLAGSLGTGRQERRSARVVFAVIALDAWLRTYRDRARDHRERTDGLQTA
ncbi:MAG: asparagine synthase (glutamine-hydrolyzing) [Gaiellaceae bacterium]